MMAVSKRLRFEILRRDNHTCRYCGQAAPDVKLTVDHVVPTTLGGTDDPTNLVTACADCNSGKSATPPDAAIVADVSEKAAVYAESRHRAIQQWRARRADLEAAVARFDEAWLMWGDGCGPGREEVERDTDWALSVERWIVAGMDVDDLIPLVSQAMRKPNVVSSKVWKYYCGIVWGHLRDIEAAAAGGMRG